MKWVPTFEHNLISGTRLATESGVKTMIENGILTIMKNELTIATGKLNSENLFVISTDTALISLAEHHIKQKMEFVNHAQQEKSEDEIFHQNQTLL